MSEDKKQYPEERFLLPEVFAIAVGAFLGAVSRVYVSKVSERVIWRGIPLATLAVNVAGSFGLGILVPSALIIHAWYEFFVVGFLSSLTTFSTFVMEIDALWGESRQSAVLYGLLSISLGFQAFLVGLFIGNSSLI